MAGERTFYEDDHTGTFVRPNRGGPVSRQMLTVIRVSSGSEMLRLAVLEPGHGVLIGRDPGAELTLDDPSASRRHAYVALEGRGIRLTDLGSTNGTWCNGEKLREPVYLEYGDRFDIGKATLRIERMSEAEIAHFRRVAERLDTARNDPLTGLLTRRWASESLPEMLEDHDRRRSPLTAVFMDIDHFKSINDTWGHPMGDEALKTVAQLIAWSIRASDAALRWGGEEFVILLANCEDRGAYETAERIRKRVGSHDWASIGLPREVTLSAGVAERGPGEEIDPWLTRADQAMYLAKRSGRNRTVLSPPPPPKGQETIP